MATSLQGLFSIANPNPNPNPNPRARAKGDPTALSRFAASSVLPGAYSSLRRCAVASGSTSSLSQSPLHGRLLRCHSVSIGSRKFPNMAPLALPSDDSKPSDFELENAKDVIDAEKESEMAWAQVLDSFKQQALKMQNLSQEAYEVYSKKAMVVLEETRKNMKIQADQASRDIAIIAREISDEGREYISAAGENSPESVKDIIEAFSAPPDELKDISKVHDFYLGIPYGAILAVGGFASFMVTGSTSAIRFGVILGSALLALSVSSLRAWKKGRRSSLLLKGQAAIAMIIFIREFRLLLQKQSLPASFMAIISGAMLVFYVYQIIVFRQSRGRSLEYGSED